MEKIKIVLADDHQIVMDGLAVVLGQDDRLEVVAALSNGQEVLDFVEKHPIHIAILDINMPVMDGLSCAKQLKSQFKDIKVIILTMYGQKSFTEQIVKIGVDGCLLKNNSGKELLSAVHRVMEGKQYYDYIRDFNEEEEDDEYVAHKLGKREIEIIQLLAKGRTSAQIADELFISEHTVSTHRKNILKKTGANNTNELIQFANSNNLL